MLAPHANMSVTSVMRVSLGYWAVTSAVVPSIFDMMLWPPVLWPWGVRCFADDAVLKTTTVPSKGYSKMKSLLPPWRLATPPMPGCRPSSSPIHMGQPQHNTGPATQAFSPANPPPAAPDGPANNRPASHSARRRSPAWLCNVDRAPQSSEPAHAQKTGPGGKPTRTQPGQAPRPSRGHRQNRSHQ